MSVEPKPMWTACVMTHDLKNSYTFLSVDEVCFRQDTRGLFELIVEALNEWDFDQRPVGVKVVASHLDKCIDLTFCYLVLEDRLELEDR